MIELVKAIQEQGLEQVCSDFELKAKRHVTYNNLVLLKYNQINSPMGKIEVQQARGIILNEIDNFRIVCRTFDKFFNYKEGNAANIDWDSAKVYNKLDGSICQLYYYDNHWIVATSGTPDAGGNVGDFNKTFKELFWEIWDNLNYRLPSDPNICYSFEMTSPFNTIVVQHEDSLITLIGARNLITQKELNPIVEAHHNKWNCVNIFQFNDKNDVISSLKNMNGLSQEGYVVVDNKYQRIKLKCEDYVKKHRLVSSMSQRNMLDVIRTNESGEVLLYCPQFKDLHYEIKTKFEYLVGKIEGFYEAIKDIDETKTFAMIAKDQKFSGILFGLRGGKGESVRELILNINIKILEDWLDIKNNLL